MEKILISACLLGEQVRYDAKIKAVTGGWIEKWDTDGRLVRVCPEVCAGMSVPRPPAQIVGGDGLDVLNQRAKVVDANGTNVTKAFLEGAQKALELARKHDIRLAVFKEKSPSCGVKQIYDGTFSSVLIPGSGVAVALLKADHIHVFSENELDRVAVLLEMER